MSRKVLKHRDEPRTEINPGKTHVTNSTTVIRDVAAALEKWAPLGLAESYDNPGLQVGDPQRAVSNGLVALDMTPQVLKEAKRLKCNLIITHHPLLFKPIEAVTPASYVSDLCLRLAEEKIALYSTHTNLDAVRGGVSFALAEQLGLENVDFLTHREDSLVKLVTFVPENAISNVREALAMAGAGQIGNYSGCSFSSHGTGHFTPGTRSNPMIGSAGGGPQTAAEIRIETEVTRWNLHQVIAALLDAHPYDEVPYDIYPVEQSFRNAGIGATGTLAEPEKLDEFLRRVSTALENQALRYVGDVNRKIQKVAVCGGSGSRYLSAAIEQGADAFVTADITYHHFFDALDVDGRPKIALIDPGHYETEFITEKLLVEFLSDKFPTIKWHETNTRTAPVLTFVNVFHTDSSHVGG